MRPFTCTLLLILLAAAVGAAELAPVPATPSHPGLDSGFHSFLTGAAARSEDGLGIVKDSQGRTMMATTCNQTNLCARANCQCSESCSGSVSSYPCILTPTPHFGPCVC